MNGIPLIEQDGVEPEKAQMLQELAKLIGCTVFFYVGSVRTESVLIEGVEPALSRVFTRSPSTNRSGWLPLASVTSYERN